MSSSDTAPGGVVKIHQVNRISMHACMHITQLHVHTYVCMYVCMYCVPDWLKDRSVHSSHMPHPCTVLAPPCQPLMQASLDQEDVGPQLVRTLPASEHTP